MTVTVAASDGSLRVHDPVKVMLDRAVTLAAGGDCLADVAVLRAEPGLFGPVASEPTVSRVIDRLAATPDAALRAIAAARPRPEREPGRWRGIKPLTTA